MRLHFNIPLALLLLIAPFTCVQAGTDDDAKYAEAKSTFQQAGQSGNLFNKSYGYALFPTIGKGGAVVGAAYGDGRVYVNGNYVGDTSMIQLSIGLQLGGQTYSEIVFFEHKDALEKFIGGKFEFGAGVSAIAITAGVSAGASTGGSATASASGNAKSATTAASYNDGIAVFTVAKGGLMYAAIIGGQKFKYVPK